MNPDEVAGFLLIGSALAQLVIMPLYFAQQQRTPNRKKN